MIDSADFHNNLGSMKTYDDCNMVGTIAELMMDQVEFANVICLNKCDLVKEKQVTDLYDKISMLNDKAKIIKSVQSKIDVKDILNTDMYKDKEEFCRFHKKMLLKVLSDFLNSVDTTSILIR